MQTPSKKRSTLFDPAGRHLPLKLGKQPARQGSDRPTFKLKDFIDTRSVDKDKIKLPTPPQEGDNISPLVGTMRGQTSDATSLLMLGNDSYGDCVEADGAHSHLIALQSGGHTEYKGTRLSNLFSTRTVLSDYSRATGFTPTNPTQTDNGTDMVSYADYRRKTGILDTAGQRHKVLAYLDLTPKDFEEAVLAIYIFKSLSVGIEFPAFAMDQFNHMLPWDIESANNQIEGGHCWTAAGWQMPTTPGATGNGAANLLEGVTWGGTVQVTQRFYEEYSDEAIVYITSDMLDNHHRTSGLAFDIDQLKRRLALLKAA